jgi:hypothetical protein
MKLDLFDQQQQRESVGCAISISTSWINVSNVAGDAALYNLAITQIGIIPAETICTSRKAIKTSDADEI